jgi:sugar lactone lactonase YvrE
MQRPTRRIQREVVFILTVAVNACGEPPAVEGDTAGPPAADVPGAAKLTDTKPDFAADMAPADTALDAADTPRADANLEVPDAMDTESADATVDGAVSDACKPTGAESCNGQDDDCNGLTDDLSGPCEDGNACTEADVCKNGTCAGTAKDCDDGQVCTEDACDPKTGACSHTPTALGQPCDDGLACTDGDACVDGKCSGSPKECAGKPCQPQACDGASGQCKALGNAPDGSGCLDGDACTGPDTCAAGACKAGAKKMCGDDQPCVTFACDPQTGACKPNPKPKGTPCDDGTVCTNGDVCTDGDCEGQNVSCADDNPCTNDPCDKVAGCSHVNNSAKCSDGEACTDGDGCVDGKCTPGLPVNCDDQNGCTLDACDKASGACKHDSQEGKPCDADGNACTAGDQCQKGACAVGKPVVCDDGKVCTGKACDPASGNCAYGAKPAGTTCDDGNACTTADGCDGKGACTGQATVCNDGKPCTADTCDAKTGACGATQQAAGAACDDGNPCTSGDTCDAAGACKAGTKNGCDDASPCTTDTCTAQKCAHAAANEGSACDDDSACTAGEACSGGKCTVSALGPVATLAGSGASGWKDGAAVSAYFFAPRGVAIAADGTVYVADTNNQRIRRILPTGTVTTLAGSGGQGFADGNGTAAAFSGPFDVAIGPGGHLWVADRGNHRIRKVTPIGQVTTLAGSATAGFADASGAAAKFNLPSAVAVDASGWAVVADANNHRIRRISPQGTVTTLAGTGAQGWLDGSGGQAQFSAPMGIALDPGGTAYVADQGNQRIRKVAPNGLVNTLAGTGASGFLDGAALQAKFSAPAGIAVHGSGAVFVADAGNHRLRRISGGVVTTVAGSTPAFQDGAGAVAKFITPSGIAVANDGTLFVGDTGNQRIRRVLPAAKLCNDGNPCTQDACDAKLGCIAPALPDGATCTDGSGCTTADTCKAGTCTGVALACDDGKPCTDDGCDPATGACVTAANTAPCTDGDACTTADTCQGGVCGIGVATPLVEIGVLAQPGWKDGAASQALLNFPTGVAFDGSGQLWIVDRNNHRIRRVSAGGQVATLAGTGAGGWKDGPGAVAQFNYPFAAVATLAGLYVSDRGNQRIRLVLGDGTTSTMAGNGVASFQDGPANAAMVNNPSGLCVDKWGAVYIADTGNQRVRKLAPDGTVATFAGSGVGGWLDGQAATARFSGPADVALDPQGNLYVADTGNQRIRKISPAGTVSTLCGNGTQGWIDATGAAAAFNNPAGLAWHPGGPLLVSDRGNLKLRAVTAAGVVTTWATGTGDAYGLARDGNNKIWLADGTSHVVRAVVPPVVNCADFNPCTADACDPKTGACSNVALPEGATCNDDDACTTGDACGDSGACKGKAKACDDGNACTGDSCDPYSGNCVQVPTTASCDDGNKCTVAETCQNGVCTVDSPAVTTAAGSGAATLADGAAPQAAFNSPRGVALHPNGTVWIADAGNHRIRVIQPPAMVTTLAGSTAGYLDGSGSTARFNAPTGLAIDAAGVGYVADAGNNRIRKLTAIGAVSTLAGDGAAGFQDGTGLGARFNSPGAVALDAAGNLWVADTGNHRIRKITPQGKVTTPAGSGLLGWLDGVGAVARFSSPYGIAVDGFGAVWVADTGNQRIRKLTPEGTTTTAAGSGAAGFSDGQAMQAAFNQPTGIAVDAIDRVWVVDRANARIRRLQSGSVTTAAGTGQHAWKDGPATAAQFSNPWGISLHASGKAWIGDQGTHRIRTIEATGLLCTDGNDCTSDACDSATGSCKFTAKPDASACAALGCSANQTCQAGKCQGGQAKFCNDGTTCTDDACDPKTGACTFQFNGTCEAIRRVFVTAQAWPGNLGGVTGAHQKCQAAADAAGLGGIWQAWIGDSATGPAQSFDKGAVPYRLLSGAAIASHWADLTDGKLTAPIDTDEKGKAVVKGAASCVVDGAKVWTGATTAGEIVTSSFYQSCSNWNYQGTSTLYKAWVGSSGRADSGWTQACGTEKCDPTVPGHLYCFEQGDHLVPKAGP